MIQAVHDGQQPPGLARELPSLHFSGGTLERRRTMLSAGLAQFETRFQPLDGPPVSSQLQHRRMAPDAAAALLREAGLRPALPLADEAGNPFLETSPGWLLIAQVN